MSCLVLVLSGWAKLGLKRSSDSSDCFVDVMEAGQLVGLAL